MLAAASPLSLTLDEIDGRLRDIERVKSRASLAWFIRYSWPVLESGGLEWTEFLQAQSDTVQAFFEGWLVAKGKGNPAMVERQDAYWRAHGIERVPGELLVQDLHVNGWPGSLKSRIAMVLAPAWLWLHDPTAEVVATSGTGDNVSRDSEHMKELVLSPWYRETFEVPWKVGVNRAGKIVDSTEKWANSAGGVRLSKDLFSSWQGVHADVLLLDDPDDEVKVYGDAERLRTRRRALAIQDRVRHPTRSIRLDVQQHVHPEDTTAHIQSKGTWSIENRSLPAVLRLPLEFRVARRIATPWGWTDPRTKDGEVAHPERHPAKWIEARRLVSGSALYEAKYNQNPKASEGGAIKASWFRFCVIEGKGADVWDRPPGCRLRTGDNALPPVIIRRKKDGRLDVDWLVLSIDPKGGSVREESSNVGLVVLAGKGLERYVLDDQSAVLGWLDTLEAIRALIRQWGPDKVLIELKQQGSSALETLRKEMAEGKLIGPGGKPVVCVFEGVEGGSDTFLERFHAMLPPIEAGLLHILDGAPWAEKYVDEHCAIPSNADKAALTSKGKKTDRVDATSQCLNYYARHGSVSDRFAAYSALAAR